MLITEHFIDWQAEGENIEPIEEDREEFMVFADEFIKSYPSPTEFMKEVLYQVYLNQCCIDGLIEDVDSFYN